MSVNLSSRTPILPLDRISRVVCSRRVVGASSRIRLPFRNKGWQGPIIASRRRKQSDTSRGHRLAATEDEIMSLQDKVMSLQKQVSDKLMTAQDLLEAEAEAERNLEATQSLFRGALTDLDVAMGDSRVQLLVLASVVVAPLLITGLYQFTASAVTRYVEGLKQSWKEAEKGEEDVLESVWDFAKDLTAGQLVDPRADETAEELEAQSNNKPRRRAPGFVRYYWSYDDLVPKEGEENITLELLLLTVSSAVVFVWALGTSPFLQP